MNCVIGGCWKITFLVCEDKTHSALIPKSMAHNWMRSCGHFSLSSQTPQTNFAFTSASNMSVFGPRSPRTHETAFPKLSPMRCPKRPRQPSAPSYSSVTILVSICRQLQLVWKCMEKIVPYTFWGGKEKDDITVSTQRYFQTIFSGLNLTIINGNIL